MVRVAFRARPAPQVCSAVLVQAAPVAMPLSEPPAAAAAAVDTLAAEVGAAALPPWSTASLVVAAVGVADTLLEAEAAVLLPAEVVIPLQEITAPIAKKATIDRCSREAPQLFLRTGWHGAGARG